MADPLRWLLCCAAAFAAGSIPFGAIIARARGVDIRQHGSKNVGATNVWRVLGWKPGLLCFALDAGKGALPVLGAGAWLGALGDPAPSAGVAWWWMGVATSAAIGHMFSPFLRFRGGKGVATGLGAMLAMHPVVTWAAVGALAVFVLSAWRTRYVGVSSCLGAIAIPVLIAALRAAGLVGAASGSTPLSRVEAGWPFIGATSLLAALIVWKHRANIRRTLDGTENRIGARAPANAPASE